MAIARGTGHVAIVVVALLAAGFPAAGGRSEGPPAGEVSVAAAADLSFAMDELAREFQRDNAGIRLNVAYGSSGNFFSQISSGAPFDLFLSADAEYPRRLASSGFGRDGRVFLYGLGRIAVVVPARSGARVEESGVRALLDPAVRHVAIANPRHAPYGRAAEAALKTLGVWDAVEGKLVYGENVAQAAQFVESGAAEAGVVAMSLVLAPVMKGRLRFKELPTGSHPAIEQGGLVLKGGAEPSAASAFRDFLLSARGRAILSRFGFEPAAK